MPVSHGIGFLNFFRVSTDSRLNTMELETGSTYAWVLALAIITWSAYAFSRKERLPRVEFLRLNEGPGKAGDAKDVQLFLDDSLGAIMKGYNEVWPKKTVLYGLILVAGFD